MWKNWPLVANEKKVGLEVTPAKSQTQRTKARMEQTDLGIKLGDVYHPYDVTIAIFPGFYAEVV